MSKEVIQCVRIWLKAINVFFEIKRVEILIGRIRELDHILVELNPDKKFNITEIYFKIEIKGVLSTNFDKKLNKGQYFAIGSQVV